MKQPFRGNRAKVSYASLSGQEGPHMFMLKLWIICTVIFFLVGCGRTIYPVSDGFHNQIPEKNTRIVVWGNHESAVGAAVTLLQRKHMRLVERARILEVFAQADSVIIWKNSRLN